MAELMVPGGYFMPSMAIWLKQMLLRVAECFSKALHGHVFSVDQG